MAINFPNNPAVNDTFTVSGTKFTFTGVKWETGAVVDLSSDTTPTLGGDLDGGAKNINNVGVITATNFTGNLTGNTSGTAGGLTGDPSIQVTNATVLGNLDVQGTTTTIDTAVTEVDSLAIDGLLTTLGSVGIGTINPATTFVVDKTDSSGLTAHILVNNSESSSGLSLLGAGSAFSSAGWPSITDAGIIRSSAGSANGIAYHASNGYHSFWSGSGTPQERLRITSAGIVSVTGTVTTGTVDLTAAGGQGSTLTGDGRLTLQFPSGGGGGVGMFSVYSGTSKNVEFFSGGSATFAGTISDSIGPLRRLGINNHNAATYTLVASDVGKLIREATNSANITIPQNVFSAGDMITIFNVSGGNNTITSGAGITLYNTADGATGNRTLAAKGVCTIACTSTNEFIISGSGLS